MRAWIYYKYQLISSDESAPPDESETQGPGIEEELGILQVIERLEKIADTLLSK